VRAQLHVSERRACAALGQHRSTQRKIPRGREDEERLTADIIELAQQYGRYGYRKVAGLNPARISAKFRKLFFEQPWASLRPGPFRSSNSFELHGSFRCRKASPGATA
jgi:hypothetical protein